MKKLNLSHELILLICNLAMTTGILISIANSESPSINVFSTGKDTNVELKDLICKSAFRSFKEGKASASLVHPELLTVIEKGDFPELKIEKDDQLFFKSIGRDVCRAIIKKEKGFSAIDAVISSDGPLGFRITTLTKVKLSVEDVRSYL